MTQGRPLLFLLPVAALLGILTGCGTDPTVGLRYQAERDLWRANHDHQRLSIRPNLVEESEWPALAQRYISIADRYTARTTSGGNAVNQEIRQVAARSLANAGQIYGSLRDTVAMMAIFERVETEFQDLTTMTGEVLFARGSIAETRRDWDKAIEAFQQVVDRIEPAPEHGTSIERLVVTLPLRIARIHRASGDIGGTRAAYADAETYYRLLIEQHPGSLVQIEAQAKMADVYTDQENWNAAIQALRSLEAQLHDLESPPRDPAEIRYVTAGALNRAGASPDSIHAVLASILDEYPTSSVLPPTLLALALNASLRGELEEALGYLDTIRDNHRANEKVSSQALLTRAQLLEKNDRWQESLEAYRSLSVEHPISEATLMAPLEIAEHYARVGDPEGMESAIVRAEIEYRDFLERYPPGPASLFAREKLIESLALQDEYEQVVEELLTIAESLKGIPQGATYFIRAARFSLVEVADTSQAISILDTAGQQYSQVDVGKWATKEADRLREVSSR